MADKELFKDQLPKYHPWDWERILAALGSVAGIIALFVTVLKLDHIRDDIATFILLVELSLLCAGLMLFLWITSRKKLHRFAQAVFFIHYVSHLIRDEVAAAEAGKPVELKAILQEIVNAVASCFSILTARRARCSIHEIKEGGYVAVVVRDSMTRTQSPPISDQKPNSIEDNTDFSNIWYGTSGCTRFFYSRNLVKLWRTNQYRNSSFDSRGQPDTVSVLGMTWVSNWTLPYKATIVWPIRYIPEGAMWPTLNRQPVTSDKAPFVWGFLSIDWGSRNSFEETYAPELGAAFADAIFTLLNSLRFTSGPRSPNSQATDAKLD